MNKVFKVIWNAKLNIFIVASEMAKGYCRSVSNKEGGTCNELPKLRVSLTPLALFSLFMLSSSGLHAADLTVHSFSPGVQFEDEITGSTRLVGGFNVIQAGGKGYHWTTLGEAKKAGLITAETSQWVDHNILRMGSQTESVNYVDPVTGNTASMKVYNNDDIQIEPASDFRIILSDPVGKNGQYVDRNFYHIGQNASLSVDVGNNTDNWSTLAGNNFNAILKSSVNNKNLSSVYHLTGNGSVNYLSKTVVRLGNSYNNIRDLGSPVASMTAADFKGEFDSVIGKQNITNIEEFKAYNDALIAAVKSGKIKGESQYISELNKARDTSVHSIYAASNIDDDDAVRYFVNKTSVSYIHGEDDSNLTIDKGANIQLVQTDATLVNLNDRATLTNNGVLGTTYNTLRGAYIITAHDNTTVDNNGVISAGTSSDIAGISVFDAGYGKQNAIMADGNSIINNNKDGAINISSRTNYNENIGVLMGGSAILNNLGTINVAATEEASSILGDGGNIGVEMPDNTTFNNEGMLYIGRMAKNSSDEIATDIAIKQKSIGVQLYGNATFNASADSSIVIGSKVQNAAAVDIGGPATLNQKGSIEINGAVNGDTATNVGIIARAGTLKENVINQGDINLNGINSIGIKVLADAQATSSGNINIEGGLDPLTHYANYGIYADGKNALAVLSGVVNLNGDGAIGVHARNNAEIDVAERGTVNFNKGVNQTGYYIYGAGSAIKNSATSTQDASTENATLYRIDGGATFTGSADSSAKLNASGQGATIVRTTGSGSHFDSGKLEFNVAGAGATGVRIEGGATGNIASDTVINIAGKNSTAGIVDGNYYKLDGTENTDKKGDSVLVSHAVLETATTAEGAFGYITRNNGRLIHEGSINFTKDNSTGVLVDGGVLENHSDVTVNGIAVNIQGENSEVTNTGTVTATDGTATYMVGNNATLILNGSGETRAEGQAHAILLDTGAKGLTVEGATINMAHGGSGNAIENKAAISGISLDNTIINVGNGTGVHTGASLAAQNSGTINVDGSGTGILFENVVAGSDTDQVLDMSDSKALVINVNAADGNGIITRTSADIKSGASVNVLNRDGRSALAIYGTTRSIEQSGELSSVSESSAVVDVNNGTLQEFINKGAILAKDAGHLALEVQKGDGISFTNASGASIRGQVNLLRGDNSVVLESGSTATDITTDNGNDNFILNNITSSENGSLFRSLNGGVGEDILSFNNSIYTMSRDDAITGMEHINLKSGSLFTLDNVNLALGDEKQDQAGTGYQIDDTSQLSILGNTDISFRSHIYGTGTISTDIAGNHFNFDTNNASDGFNGALALTDTQFELSGVNTQALNQATLRIGEASVVHVGAGEQQIGGLALSGGLVQFEGVTLGNPTATGIIQAGAMDLTGRGTVQVDSGAVSNDRPVPETHLPVLEQDDALTLIKLADSETEVKGDAANVTLIDREGNTISDGISADITQDGSTVAQGHYDYRLTSGDSNDGLYISYGLTQVDLQGQGSEALILDASDKKGNAADLSARVTGHGDLAFDSQLGQTVTLSNMDNDYTGITEIRSGNLAMLNNHVLGDTSELKLATGTGFDMQGYSQTVGKLQTEYGSLTNLNGGQLTLAEGGNSLGELAGAGSLIVAGGTLNITGANANLSSVTTIAGESAVVADDIQGLGTGDIIVGGGLTFNGATGILNNNISDGGSMTLTHSDILLKGDNSHFAGLFNIDNKSVMTANNDSQLGSSSVSNEGQLVFDTAENWLVENRIFGSGSVLKQGSGNIFLDESAQWTGTTTIDAGGVILGSADNALTFSSQQINVAEKGLLAGFGGVVGNINNQGAFVVGQSDSSSTTVNSVSPVTFTIGGNLTNNGVIWIGKDTGTTGNQLVVDGDYEGNGGLIHLNTVLGDDSSVTDKLIVKGNTSGKTDVSVTNAGGIGAKTINGIEVIRVDGVSAGEFAQKGRIVAGAYDYSLVRGQGDSAGNWYLTNKDVAPQPAPGPEPEPENVRPEPASYTANLAAANTMFTTRLHDRLGETQYIDALSGEKRITSMWLRQVGGHNRWQDNTGKLKTQSNRYVVQLGGDIAQWSRNGLDRWHVGVMAGYGHNNSNTHSSSQGYGSTGSVSGYSIGMYGTWYANDATHQGTYVDSWLQYGWFNNHVNGQNIDRESYKSKGITGSLELGYTHKLGEFSGSKGSTNEWFIQPQAQAIWMGVEADNHREENGTRVHGEGDGNIQTRLGIRTFLKGHNAIDDGKEREFQPFIEANWIHNTREFGTRMNGISIHQDGSRNLGEIKTGVEGKINPKLNLWGNVGVQLGDSGYSDTAAMIGIKYNFK
ncbi:TPA: autotransporter outer membrane beta-barrel domain-containing protein [Pluralibacter gergoviae]